MALATYEQIRQSGRNAAADALVRASEHELNKEDALLLQLIACDAKIAELEEQLAGSAATQAQTPEHDPDASDGIPAHTQPYPKERVMDKEEFRRRVESCLFSGSDVNYDTLDQIYDDLAGEMPRALDAGQLREIAAQAMDAKGWPWVAERLRSNDPGSYNAISVNAVAQHVADQSNQIAELEKQLAERDTPIAEMKKAKPQTNPDVVEAWRKAIDKEVGKTFPPFNWDTKWAKAIENSTIPFLNPPVNRLTVDDLFDVVTSYCQHNPGDGISVSRPLLESLHAAIYGEPKKPTAEEQCVEALEAIGRACDYENINLSGLYKVLKDYFDAIKREKGGAT
jgi:hypothetical protein